MEYDCGDLYCFLELRLVDNCFVYTPNSKPNCSIPCALDNCDFIIYHEINCPIYHCVPSSTTFKPKPTAVTTSIPDPIPDSVEGINIFSYLLNIVCIVVFIAISLKILFKFLKKRELLAERAALLKERQTLNNTFASVSIDNSNGFELIELA